MQLSKRLLSVAGMVTPGYPVADIGTDHAYIPIYLTENGIIPSAVASDINSGPLERALGHIREHHLEDKIETRKSDGLEFLRSSKCGPVSVVIAGMGGALTVRILSDGSDIEADIRGLILQPQSEVMKVRLYLQQTGWMIVQEDMVFEDGKYYPVIKAEKIHEKEMSEADLTPLNRAQLMFGPELLRMRHPVLHQFLLHEKETQGNILEALGSAKNDSASERAGEIKNKIEIIDEAMMYYKEVKLMEEKEISVYVEGKKEEYPEGISLEKIADAHKEDFTYRIVLANADGRLRELSKCAEDGSCIHFITLKDKDGRDTYIRSLVMLMLKSIYYVAGDRKIDFVGVHFSVGDSFYCTMKGIVQLNQDFLDEVKKYMHELADRAEPIGKKCIPTWEACRLFHDRGMYDKEELFRYRRSSWVNIYNLEDFEDYFYGYMVPDTSYLTCFDLQLFEDGFLLRFPSLSKPGELSELRPEKKVWRAQKDALEWGSRLGIPTVGALNTYIANNRVKDLIMVQEAYQEKKIAELAAQIAAAPDKRIVLIAGPSSSGKTTFSHRLSTQLSVYGLKPHPIEADNYFVNRENTPVDENGQLNFECLEAIDVEQLNEDMLNLLDGKTVEMPRFNFRTGKREYKGDYLTLGPSDILIIEGIHCLNDKLTYRLSPDYKYKIYISALTQLNIDEHNRISTTDGRMLRRIVRDARTRGTDVRGTIDMWPSVRRGEEEYIFPFQESADYVFNSTLIYECAVLKQYAEPLLFSVRPDEPEYTEARRLLKFLDYFLPIPGDDIPNNSLLREFIGGGCFES